MEGGRDGRGEEERGRGKVPRSLSFHHSSLPLHPLLVMPHSGLFLSLPRHPISTSSSLLSTEIKRVEAGEKKKESCGGERRGGASVGGREGEEG